MGPVKDCFYGQQEVSDLKENQYFIARMIIIEVF